MPSIGGFSVTGWRGRLRPAAPLVDLEDAQPGVDGHIASVGAYRAQPAEITTSTDVSTIESVNLLVTRYLSLIGTTVVVVDPFFYWPGVFVQAMVPEWDQLLTGGYRVTATWVLVPQSIAPP